MTIKVYEVGGCVRDSIIGRKYKDIDYSVECPSFSAMREWIIARGGEIFLENPEFLTIRARMGRGTFDYVMCRKDGAYNDGRHPDMVEPGTIDDDLARRDFTMNAIARKEDGSIYDPFGGMRDIKNRIIRCVGSVERIWEDPLRLIRAVRFSIVLGFWIHPHIISLFDDTALLAKMTDSVSEERIREEVNKMLAYDTIKTLAFFAEHPKFMECIFSGGLWLKATNEKK